MVGDLGEDHLGIVGVADADADGHEQLALLRYVVVGADSGVPLDEIAARADVEPGTVYRHFPTNEALFDVVITARIGDLIADARTRAGTDDSGDAFLGFLTRRGQEAIVKRDVSDAIAVRARCARTCTRRSACRR